MCIRVCTCIRVSNIFLVVVVIHARRNHRVNTPTRATSTKKTKASRSFPTAHSSAPSSSPSWPPPSGSPRKCRKPALHRSLISFPRRVRLPFYSFYIHVFIPRRRFIHTSQARARRHARAERIRAAHARAGVPLRRLVLVLVTVARRRRSGATETPHRHRHRWRGLHRRPPRARPRARRAMRASDRGG